MCVNTTYCFYVSLLSVPGSVDVAVDSLDMGVEVEKWYPVTMESNKTNGGESSSIRLRFKYQVKLHCLTLQVVFFLCCCFYWSLRLAQIERNKYIN